LQAHAAKAIGQKNFPKELSKWIYLLFGHSSMITNLFLAIRRAEQAGSAIAPRQARMEQRGKTGERSKFLKNKKKQKQRKDKNFK
jgi:hypothetical protein